MTLSQLAATASAVHVNDITFGITPAPGGASQGLLSKNSFQLFDRHGIFTDTIVCLELDTSNDEEFARRLQAEFEAEEAGARLTSIPTTITPPPTMATSPQPLAAPTSHEASASVSSPSHLESDMEYARSLQEELDREEAQATAAALSQRTYVSRLCLSTRHPPDL